MEKNHQFCVVPVMQERRGPSYFRCFWLCKPGPVVYTLWLFNIAMENHNF